MNWQSTTLVRSAVALIMITLGGFLTIQNIFNYYGISSACAHLSCMASIIQIMQNEEILAIAGTALVLLGVLLLTLRPSVRHKLVMKFQKPTVKPGAQRPYHFYCLVVRNIT